MDNQPEVWLRGAVAGIPPLLQPVAHALLQAREEVSVILEGFPEQCLWEKPAGLASVGFHLQHLTGVLDRLFTYAAAQPLTQTQLDYLSREGTPGNPASRLQDLLTELNNQVEKALLQLSKVDESMLTDFRAVGRKQLPSTVLGLLFHAAEHTQRHVGQLLVTARMLESGFMEGGSV